MVFLPFLLGGGSAVDETEVDLAKKCEIRRYMVIRESSIWDKDGRCWCL